MLDLETLPTGLVGPPANNPLVALDQIVSFSLSNGTRLVVLPRPGSTSVSLKVYIGCGSQFEADHQHGICHMLEHYLFKATRRHNGAEIYDAIENYGGQINAATHREYLALSAHVPTGGWGQALDLLTEILTEPAFDPIQLEQEKLVVIEEINRKQDNQGQVWDLLLGAIWGEDNFSRPVLGTPQTVKSFGVADIREYYDARFSGPNTAVVIVGEVEPYAVYRRLERALQNYPSHPVASYAPNQAALSPVAPPRQLKTKKNTFVSTLLIGWPTITQYDRATNHQLKVLNRMLGVGGMGWLRQELREKHNLVYNVQSVSVSYATRGYLAAMLSVGPQNVERVIELIRGQIERLQTDLTEPILAKNRSSYEGSLAVLYDNPVKLSEYFGLNALMGVEDSFAQTVAQVRAVTTAQIQTLAARYLAGSPYVALLGQ